MKKLLASMLAAFILLAAVPQMCFANDMDIPEKTAETISTYDCVDEPHGDIN